MASGASIEILDLRHFSAPVLLPVLEAEGALWLERLHWNYSASIQASDAVPGWPHPARLCGPGGRPHHRLRLLRLRGDPRPSSATPLRCPASAPTAVSAHEIEETLLKHLLELIVNSPQVERIESQLLLHPSGTHSGVFLDAGFQVSPQALHGAQARWLCFAAPRIHLPVRLDLRPWRDDDLNAAAQLIYTAYRGHPDSVVNDQYNTLHGSTRFLNNIVRFSGCGVFSPPVSHVVIDRLTREMVALVLGSRVSPQSGHITQLCVHPGLSPPRPGPRPAQSGCLLLLRQGASEIPSPSPKPTPTPSISTAPKATTATIPSTPPSGSAIAWRDLPLNSRTR
jgi:hypothetical protein